MELYKKSAAELSALLRSKEVTACEILDDTLARIDAVEPKVDAFLVRRYFLRAWQFSPPASCRP